MKKYIVGVNILWPLQDGEVFPLISNEKLDVGEIILLTLFNVIYGVARVIETSRGGLNCKAVKLRVSR